VIPPEARRWARERGAQMAEALSASGVRVVGDPADLIPAEPAPAAAPAPAPPTETELLDTAVDAVAGLGAVLAEARIEHDALTRVVHEHFADEQTDADWQEFAAYEQSLPEQPPSGRTMMTSRFLRWWLAR
jgi:hypothetical protein